MMESLNKKTEVISIPTADGTDGHEVHPKHWVAALVQARHEKAVGERLDKMQVENFVPTQWEIHQWSDRKKKVERVVIPMVVFARVDQATEKRLRTYSFIYKLLSYPGQHTAAVIPDTQIERLKYMLRHSESAVEMQEHPFRIGETVRIARGPLKNLEGELCFMEADKPMVAVRIDCLGYACVNIDKSDIESVS